MANEQELLALLVEANEATNEIADDIQKLLAREPNISEATMQQVRDHLSKLKGVAAAYTPETTGGETGGDETGGEDEPA